jgi:hypothetical protein
MGAIITANSGFDAQFCSGGNANSDGGGFNVAEPVERQIFAGAGAWVFRPGFGSEYVNSYKMLQKALNFAY